MTNEQSVRSDSYTGGIRELIVLFSPILFISFSNCFFILIEKLLLAQLSIQAMEAAVNAAYASQIFQIPCISLVMMAQVFVGRWKGAGEVTHIGSGIWQFIWFSFLSMLITLPASIIYGNLYFKDTAIADIVLPYFYLLIGMNFLFPLGTALTCFFIGLGKTRLLFFATIGFQSLKLILGYLLIFGWENIIPGFGLMGGAVSTCIAQTGFCLTLFFVFINRKHIQFYHTDKWKFKLGLFWECMNPGLLRAFNRILTLTSWAATAHLMSAKGESYLLALSIGGSLFLFLPFIGDAICQAQTTIVSHILGSGKMQFLQRSLRSCLILSFIMIFALMIPLVFMPSITFHYLFPNVHVDAAMVAKMFIGIWICFAFFTFSFVPISYILAFKDTKFSMFMGFVSWVNGYLLMYLFIEIMQISADQFWLCLSIVHAITGMMYYMRMQWLTNKIKNVSVQEKPQTNPGF